MEIFMRNLPPGFDERKLKKSLRPYVNAIGVQAYDVFVFRRGGLGTLTLPTAEHGRVFLARFGAPQMFASRGRPNPTGIKILGKNIAFSESNKRPDIHALNALREQQDLLMKPVKPEHKGPPDPAARKFAVNVIECGVWEVSDTNTLSVFRSYYKQARPGTIYFAKDYAKVTLEDNSPYEEDDILGELLGCSTKDIIVLHYQDVVALTLNPHERHITFAQFTAPRIYRETTLGDFVEMDLKASQTPRRKRVSSLDSTHAIFVAFAFTYRLHFSRTVDVSDVKQLSRVAGIPEMEYIPSLNKSGFDSFVATLPVLLGRIRVYPYRVAFQLTALFANGIVSPENLLNLLPRVDAYVRLYGNEDTAGILQALVDNIDYQNPLDKKTACTQDHLAALLTESAERYMKLKPQREEILAARKDDGRMALIHHVLLTPAGCYFSGPKMETQNRVLRNHSEFHDCFLRVTLGEESGDLLQYERNVDPSLIFKRFKEYLYSSSGTEGGKLVIGGREFSFLGFSSSSLRNHTCWFMSPFIDKGKHYDAAGLIKTLGDFSHIKTPGKCAARIGQAFSNTINSVHVPESSEVIIPDVERNGRCFSDGCGTISKQMVQRIWDQAPNIARLKPLVFQIRFGGSKGVISVDTRLMGDKLCLRPSMIKFAGSSARNIEICSTAHKPLPMYLNRQLIKILEDLQVDESTFMDLQKNDVDTLREAARKPSLAANFLERRSVGVGAFKLPWLINTLHKLDMNFRDDKFLGQAVELAVLVALREIKYKAHILVPGGYTLMGIMDETGFLKEGEIFCRIESEGCNMMILGDLVISRSPALHPGDVQVCKGVSAPLDSPLQALRNVVIFSQHGTRDLPSCLSGGDLDGDLYQVIWDPRFRPQRVYDPADYSRAPPHDLGREVRTEDMVNFMLDFIQNDKLGLISIRHMQIADGSPKGVLDPDCLILADMASISVDFPKTGIAVDIQALPRASRARPDFMAPGPHLHIEDGNDFEPQQAPREDYGDDDEDNTPVRYYRSKKVLGKLYRNIDERGFLEDIHHGHETLNVTHDVWAYIAAWVRAMGLDIPWRDYTDLARDLKDNYDDTVRALMTEYAAAAHSGALREVEVFLGCIVGKGKQNRREKDNSAALKEDYERILNFTVESIRATADRDRPLVQGSLVLTTLARGMACLWICVDRAEVEREARLGGPRETLKSFAWLAASVALQAVDHIQKREARKRNGY